MRESVEHGFPSGVTDDALRRDVDGGATVCGRAVAELAAIIISPAPKSVVGVDGTSMHISGGHGELIGFYQD
jgi:hypothetical protein